MKKLFTSLMVLCLCIILAACAGEKAPQAPAEPTEWLISKEYISQRLTEFSAREEFRSLLETYEELSCNETNLYEKAYGPYLLWAEEFYGLELDGQDYHFILMGIEADIQTSPDMYTDRLMMVYDITSGKYYDSVNQYLSQYSAEYAAIADDIRMIALNGPDIPKEIEMNLSQFYPDHIFYRALAANEVEELNTALSLEPVPDRSLGSAPEIHTSPEERKQLIINAIKDFAASSYYYNLFPGGQPLTISNAMEAAENTTFNMHVILIELDNVNTELLGDTSNKLVLDVNTQQLYNHSQFDFNIEVLDTQEKVFAVFSEIYGKILAGEYENLWSNVSETDIPLTQEEINAINEELISWFTENPIPLASADAVDSPNAAPAVDNPNAAPIGEYTVSEEFMLEAARNILASERYQSISKYVDTLLITDAFEYTLPEYLGSPVHILVFRLDGIDIDMYGYSANTFIVEIPGGKVYSEVDVNMDNWSELDSIDDFYAALLSGPQFWEDPACYIWTEMESKIYLPQEMLNAVNSQIAQ